MVASYLHRRLFRLLLRTAAGQASLCNSDTCLTSCNLRTLGTGVPEMRLSGRSLWTYYLLFQGVSTPKKDAAFPFEALVLCSTIKSERFGVILKLLPPSRWCLYPENGGSRILRNVGLISYNLWMLSNYIRGVKFGVIILVFVPWNWWQQDPS